MNENLNLVEILKDCPKGTKLWSPLFGEVIFDRVDVELANSSRKTCCIYTQVGSYSEKFSKYGFYFPEMEYSECVLFPSKNQRNWSKFQPKNPKFDPKTLKLFDRVIARICDGDAYCWFADFVSMPATVYDRIPCIMSNKDCNMVIPYNEETKHLVGTTEEAPEYYRYWED